MDAPGSDLDFRLLGPLEVTRAGRALPLGAAKHRALLVMLLLRRGEVVTFDQLIDSLWDERPPASAANALQVYVSQLRKELAGDQGRRVIETHPLGYLLRVPASAVDLHRFEQLWQQGRELLAAGDADSASSVLTAALALWRGAPLADVVYDSFGGPEARRLEEMRMAAVEDRLDADLARGEHRRLAGELEHLVEQYPLRERLAGQLMIALYRSGRQAEAMEAAAAARRRLDEQFGLAPGQALRDLERAVLNQDASLDRTIVPAAAASAEPRSGLLAVAAWDDDEATALLSLAVQLAAAEPRRELIALRLLSPGGPGELLGDATRRLGELLGPASRAGVVARQAVFTSDSPAEDIARLAEHQEFDLVLAALDGAELDPWRRALLTGLSCDVGLLAAGSGTPLDGPVVVPFAGGENDWAAVAAASWIARAHDSDLRLLGVGLSVAGRDASRLLASASLVAQRAFGVVPVPVLIEGGAENILAEARGARLLVTGLSPRWREEGLGATRSRIAAADGAPPVLLLRSGLRPSAWAPGAAATRYTWSASSG